MNWRQALLRMNRIMPGCFSWLNQDIELLDKIDQSPLSRLPLTTSRVLEQWYYNDAINPLAKRDDLYTYRTSGTSSGIRKTIYYTQNDEDHYLRIKLDVFKNILGKGNYRKAVADMGTGHAAATAVDVFRKLGMEAETISFQRPVEEHIAHLSKYRPDVLYTMPSILDRILHASSDPQAYRIQKVILVGEIATLSWIKRVADILGIAKEQITDTYGSIEIGTIAYYSHPHQRYLLTEGIWAEGLQGREISDSLTSLEQEDERVLVLTSTVREAFPAFRYVTYDVVRDLRAMDINGKKIQSFKSIVKRVGPDLKHGEKISIYDIETVVLRHLKNAMVRVSIVNHGLVVTIYDKQAAPDKLLSIRKDLEAHLPEIKAMIHGGILQPIQVLQGDFNDSLYNQAVKNKKIHYD